ncbi:MAG: 30S ribosomal protein S6 [Pyrinomonadaceae bacterium]
MAQNRVYELMYIAPPDTAVDDVDKLNEAISKLIETEGGSVVKVENIGIRRLAYKINKYTDGFYVLFEIEGSGQEIAELERRMRVNDTVVRFMTVRVDEDRKKADKIRAKRENRNSRRKAETASTGEQEAAA